MLQRADCLDDTALDKRAAYSITAASVF